MRWILGVLLLVGCSSELPEIGFSATSVDHGSYVEISYICRATPSLLKWNLDDGWRTIVPATSPFRVARLPKGHPPESARILCAYPDATVDMADILVASLER